MKRTALASVFLLFLLPILVRPVFALKKRIRQPKQPGVSYSSVRLSRGTNSVVVTFLNMEKAKTAEYMLSYTANGLSQGAMGRVTSNGKASDSRDLYFGTCSKGVCTPHYNIRNAVLTITTTFPSGATYIKRYRLKV